MHPYRVRFSVTGMSKRKNIWAVGMDEESLALLDILDDDFLVATATSVTQRMPVLTPTLMKTLNLSPVHKYAEMRTRRPVGVWMGTSFRGDI